MGDTPRETGASGYPAAMAQIDRRTVLATSAVAATGVAVSVAGCAPGHSEEARKGPATIAKASVPVGSGIVLPDANFVVTQPRAGEFHAFVKLCRHAGCAVSEVNNDRILCPCHGSQFDLVDGHVKSGPAQQPLSPATVTEKGDSLEVSG